MSEVRRFADPTALASAAAQYVLETLQGVIATRGRALVALAGGATPKELYERLGEVSSATFPWGQVHLFWGDERFVPYDSPDSNFRLAEESLLSRGAVPLGNVHPVPVEEADPEAAARAYELALRGFLPEAGPSFDLTVLGVGKDGHTASLFPDSDALREATRWVVAVPRASQPPFVPRVTLTLPLLNRSQRVVFLAAGPEKSAALVRVFASGDGPNERPPAALVHGREATLWFVDRAAAAELGPAS